jgi:hypothetical protein
MSQDGVGCDKPQAHWQKSSSALTPHIGFSIEPLIEQIGKQLQIKKTVNISQQTSSKNRRRLDKA